MANTTESLDRLGRIATNQIRGVKNIPVVSERYDLTAFTEQTLWIGPVENYTFTDPSSARINRISSSSALDVGIQIFVNGLDENWQEVTQVVTLNGQNKVDLNPELIRIQPGCQAFQDLNGDVYIYEDGTITNGIPDNLNTVKGYIESDQNIMKGIIYSVPVGHIAFPRGFDFGSIPSATCCLRFINFANYFSGVTQRAYSTPLIAGGTTFINVFPEAVYPFPQKTDLQTKVRPSTPGSAGTIVATFEQVQISHEVLGGGVINW